MSGKVKVQKSITLGGTARKTARLSDISKSERNVLKEHSNFTELMICVRLLSLHKRVN